MIRLNKYLSEAGVCSRREADRLIEAGRVTVDGVQAVPGMKVSKEQKICVGKKVIQGAEQTDISDYHTVDRLMQQFYPQIPRIIVEAKGRYSSGTATTSRR